MRTQLFAKLLRKFWILLAFLGFAFSPTKVHAQSVPDCIYVYEYADVTVNYNSYVDAFGGVNLDDECFDGSSDTMMFDFEVTNGEWLVYQTAQQGSGLLSDDYSFPGAPGTTYTAQASAMYCWTGAVTGINWGELYCMDDGSASASATTPTQTPGGGSGSNPLPNPLAPEIYSMTPTSGSICDWAVPMTILGANLNPADGSLVITTTPFSSFYIDYQTVSDSEIDAYYYVNCGVDPGIGNVIVNTTYGQAVSPDFTYQ
jgi:hypothetical protein